MTQQSSSPLGQYASLVAAVAAIGVIGAFVVGKLIGLPGAADLEQLALIAVGAVFGSAVAVNGWRAPVAAANHRLDAIGAPAASALPSPTSGTNP